MRVSFVLLALAASVSAASVHDITSHQSGSHLQATHTPRPCHNFLGPFNTLLYKIGLTSSVYHRQAAIHKDSLNQDKWDRLNEFSRTENWEVETSEEEKQAMVQVWKHHFEELKAGQVEEEVELGRPHRAGHETERRVRAHCLRARLRRALLSLTPLESLIMAFVIGAGLGSILHCVLMLCLLSARALRSKKAIALPVDDLPAYEVKEAGMISDQA
ncbi:hypothetical protein P7C73_g6515, partial [Tremellales sp. Uapishka_1]